MAVDRREAERDDLLLSLGEPLKVRSGIVGEVPSPLLTMKPFASMEIGPGR